MSDAPSRRPRDWRAVLFDLDGTLADTVPLILASFHHAVATVRGDRLPDEAWLQHLGRPLRDSFAELARDADEAVALQQAYVAFQREAHDRMVRVLPGAVEVVDALTAHGVPVAIVTSKRREMTLRTLGVIGLADRFATIVTPDEVTHGKPHPEPVLRALADLSLTGAAADVLFVGDSPFDVAAGRDAGTRTAGLTWGTFSREALAAERPDHLWDDLGPLLTG